MGILSRALGLVQAVDALQLPGPSRPQLRSGLAGDTLARISAAELFGPSQATLVTRHTAMAIPAIAKGRHSIVAALGTAPLRCYRGADEIDAPEWLSKTRGQTSPAHRMVWTVDDLIFYGWSLWAVERAAGTGDELGEITDAVRVPQEFWTFDPDGRITVGSQPVLAPTVVLIPGFTAGILADSEATISAAAELEAAYRANIRNPIPAVELHQTTADELTDNEISALIADWEAALSATGGRVAWTPASIDVRPHGQQDPQLLIEGRNAAAVDAARILGMPAPTLDASGPAASLTYETREGRNTEFQDFGLSLYAGAIAARLSMDDVTAPGTRIALDLSTLLSVAPSPSGPPAAD